MVDLSILTPCGLILLSYSRPFINYKPIRLVKNYENVKCTVAKVSVVFTIAAGDTHVNESHHLTLMTLSHLFGI